MTAMASKAGCTCEGGTPKSGKAWALSHDACMANNEEVKIHLTNLLRPGICKYFHAALS